MRYEIHPIGYSDDLFASLLDQADDGQFLFRLREQWLNGSERYDRPGELLLGAFEGSTLVGVGAVGFDPYEPEPGLGRLRHVYVLKSHRGRGLGKQIVELLIDHAHRRYKILRLKTENPIAAQLYEKLGFTTSSEGRETHRLALQMSSVSRP